MAKFLIIAGAGLILAGVLWHFGLLKWVGKLPGDLRIEKEGFAFYFPLTTCLLISLLGIILSRLAHLLIK